MLKPVVINPRSRSEMLEMELTVHAMHFVENCPEVTLEDRKKFSYRTWKPDLVYKVVREDKTIFVPVKFHHMNKSGGVAGKFLQFQSDMNLLHAWGKCRDQTIIPMMVLTGEGCNPLRKVLKDYSSTKSHGIVNHGYYVDTAINDFIANGNVERFFNFNFLKEMK